jgi:uncharacterized membrane protein
MDNPFRFSEKRILEQPKRPFWMTLLPAAAVFWCLMIVAPTWLDRHNPMQWMASSGLRMFFSSICHQIPERSFQLAGEPLAVCARCTGIYFGFALAALVLWMLRIVPRRMSRPVMIACFLPMALEAIGSKGFGVETGLWLRAATGLPAGALAAWGVWIAFSEIFSSKMVPKATPFISKAA